MRWSALLLSLAACTSVTELPRPPDDGASAAVTFYLAGDDVVAAVAADVEPGWGPPSFSGAAGVTELVVVELGCPLATLGLAPGEQALGSAADAPAFVSAYRMVLDVGAWTAVDEVDDLLGRLPFAFDPGCPVLTRVEVGEPIDYGVGLEDGAVLVATATRLLRVSIDGSVSTFGERPARTFAATRTAELLWLVADDAVWRGSMVAGFERIPLSNGESTDRGWVDGTSGFGAAELVVVTKSGVGLVYREGADAWDRGPFNGNAVSPWVNPREGLPYAGVLRVSSLDMFTAGGQRLVHSRIRPRPQPCTDRVEFTGMVQMPTGEILVGDVDGEISLVRTDQVRPVCDASPPTSTVGPTLERLLSFDVRPMNDIGVFDGALLALLPDTIAIRRDATLQCAPETVIGQRVLERTVGGAAIREDDAVVFVRKSPCAR
ncbi:MAG: hypothetical protein RMA76_39100 [Deltaproteobacteria bacterium]|jgi:hypothetical protein